MEGQSEQAPLKVCPHCAVASRTDAETCPSCGKPYVRRPLRWRWWLAIPIIILAFGVGYGGRKLIQGNDTESAPEGITLEQAQAVKIGISRPELIDRLGQDPALVKHPDGQTCLLYLVTDQPNTDWQFCFKGAELAVSSTYIPTP